MTARCIGACEILWIDEAAFGRLYYQHPAFGLFLCQRIVNRMLETQRISDVSSDQLRPASLTVIEPAQALKRDAQDDLP